MPSTDKDSRQRESEQLGRVLAEADGSIESKDDGPVEPDISVDRTKEVTRTSFSRMRVTWSAEDLAQLQFVSSAADQMLRRQFPYLYWFLEHELYPAVREPEVDGAGERIRDLSGAVRWRRDDEGHIVERWDRMTDEVKKQLLYTITTHLIAWRQQAATSWGSAMFAKGLWEEQFANGYIGAKGSRLTIDDKTQQARLVSAEERYFAIYLTMVSRRADALVKSMERMEDMLLKSLRS
jgi:hypothetical protein